MNDHFNMKIVTSLFIFLISVFALISTERVVAAVETSENKPIVITVRPLSGLLSNAQSSAPASIISLNHSVISAEITGRVIKTSSEVGERVKKGEVLATIDCRTYQLAEKQARAALKVAKTQFNLAKKQYNRNRALVRQGTIPRELFDQSEANQQTSLADIELKNVSIESTQLAVSRCLIRAPFSGQLTQRLVQQGQLVTSGSPLFKLLQTDKLEITARLSPAEIIHIKESPLLEFVVGDKRFKTTLRSIINTVDETTRTQEVRLSLTNPLSKRSHVATGLSGRLEWSSKKSQIPAEYILRREGGLGVLAIVDITNKMGKAKFYKLADAREGQPAYIDLSGNTLIIDQNRYRVKDGQTVKIE